MQFVESGTQDMQNELTLRYLNQMYEMRERLEQQGLRYV